MTTNGQLGPREATSRVRVSKSTRMLVLEMIRMAEARVVAAKVVLTARMAKARSPWGFSLLARKMGLWKVLRRNSRRKVSSPGTRLLQTPCPFSPEVSARLRARALSRKVPCLARTINLADSLGQSLE